jgi:hypothetical protein
MSGYFPGRRVDGTDHPCHVAVAGLAVPAVSLVSSSSAPRQPALRVHAIFSGDLSGSRETGFRAGEVLQVGLRHAGGRRLTQVCWSPAPIARPACSPSGTAASAGAGITAVTATLDDGTMLTRRLRVLPAATKEGGSIAVPATIRCQDVTLFGNYDRRRHRYNTRRAMIKRGAGVALYNRLAPDVIFMWDYATNQSGFGSERCAQPDSGTLAGR